MKMNARVVAVAMLMEVLLMGASIEALSVCNVPATDLLACKPAVTDPPAEPTQECCSAMSKADMSCLCEYKSSPILGSLGIDPKLAVELPVKCKLSKIPSC